jgi:hypothetical protein
LPRLARSRNSSREGVMECWSIGVMEANLHHSITPPLHYSNEFTVAE